MSYNQYSDPYYGTSGAQHQAPHDPYGAQEAHRTYDQGGYDPYAGAYRDDPTTQNTYANAAGPDNYGAYGAGASGAPKERTASGFDRDEFSPTPTRRPSKSAATVRSWRYEHQENLWTAGSRGRCFGRFCGCFLLCLIFLLISILLSLALWIRPPSVTIGQISENATGSTVQASSTGFSANLNVNITVDNPNFFEVSFKDIKVNLIYPINNTAIGGGTAKNVDFHAHSNHTFDFPFSLQYVLADDPDSKVLSDLLSKCGIPTGAKSDITVNYKLTLGLKILFFTINPVIRNSFTFACPISDADVQALLKAAGLGGGLASLLDTVS